MKLCSTCKIEKSPDNFYKDTRTRDRLESLCKKCRSAGNRRWLKKNYLKHRRYLDEFQWKRRGLAITTDEYNQRLQTQNNACAICLKTPGKIKLAVDHDHKTGIIRGLLCSWCNRYLVAMIEHQLFSKAQQYLKGGFKNAVVIY